MIDEPSGRKHPVHQPTYERFNTPIIVFLTVCTKRHKRMLANERVHAVLRGAWGRADSWLVGRYVIMPTHVHLFCAPILHVPRSLERWVAYWKSIASQTWPEAADLPIWQRHFWDTQLRRGENYDAKWDYVAANPVRAGLVERTDQWPFQGELNFLRW